MLLLDKGCTFCACFRNAKIKSALVLEKKHQKNIANRYLTIILASIIISLGALSLFASAITVDLTVVAGDEEIVVNQPPVAIINPTKNGLIVTLDGSTSYDPDGDIVSYGWNLGDGSTASNSAIVTHEYASYGNYSISLTVTDNNGSKNLKILDLNITGNISPIANINKIVNGLSVNFDGSGSYDPDGNITTYSWNFGDESSGSGINTTHRYASYGTYVATLTVTDNQGDTGVKTAEILTIANIPPIAHFSFEKSGESAINTDGRSSYDLDGVIIDYSWNFGDESSGSGATATHRYAQEGVYIVTLIVTDDSGATASKSFSFDTTSLVTNNDDSADNDTVGSNGDTGGTNDDNGSETTEGKVLTIGAIIAQPSLAVKAIQEVAANVRANPTVQKSSQNVVAPAIAIGATAVLYVSSITLFSSLLDIIPFLNYLFNLLLNLLFIKKKGKSWGVVYDSTTKEPVDLAIVRLLEVRGNNIKQTSVTDKNGRFSFRPDKGNYYLTVTKPGFVFPSKFMVGLNSDGKFDKLYFGHNVSVRDQHILDFSIPVDPAQAMEVATSPFDRIKTFLERLSMPILAIGLLLSLFVLWIKVTPLNIAILTLYILLIGLKVLIARPSDKPWGHVIDINTKKPIPGLVLRIFDKKYNKLLETKVTDEKGAFGFLLPAGEYYIKLVSYQYKVANKKHKIRHAYYGEPFTVKKNSNIRINIPLVHSSSSTVIAEKTKTGTKTTKSELKPDSIFKYLELRNKNVSDFIKGLK